LKEFANGTVYHGEALQVLMNMPSESIDCVLTDPPYSTGGTYAGQRQQPPSVKYQSSDAQKKHHDFHGDNRDQRSFITWATLWLSECYRVSKPGSVLMTFTDWRQLPAMTDALQAGGWLWRNIVVWDKPTARPTLGGFRNQCEYVLVGVKGKFQPCHRQCLPGVFKHSIVSHQRKQHMTEKPLPLLIDLLAISPEGGVVLDPFMGSGSTGAAALSTGRKFIGVEMDNGYYEVACRRVFGGEKASFC
jgi:site-specific DNA-methyltransferase (adenine-specific)